MTWIEATHQRNFEVNAPLEEVAQVLSDPSQIRRCMPDLETGEKVDDQTWRWILEEVGAKGITFQGDYTVRYHRDDEDVVTWKSEGEGTMRTEGRAEFSALSDDRTQVEYEETLASDLPIPKLARRVFKPIVARQVKAGVDDYLDEVIAYLNAGKHREDDGS